MVYIAKILNTNQSIKKAVFQNNDISYEAVKVLAQTQIENKKLIHLDLRDNPINDEGAQQLTYLLTHNFRIIRLELSENYTYDAIGLGGAVTIKINPEILSRLKDLLLFNQTIQARKYEKNYFFKTKTSLKQELVIEISLLETDLFVRFDQNRLIQLLALKHLQCMLLYKSETEAICDTIQRYPEAFNSPLHDSRKQFYDQLSKMSIPVTKPTL